MKFASKRHLLLCVLWLLVGACSTSMDVTSDYDKTANYSDYKTYALDAFRAPDNINPMNKELIIDAVKTQMAGKGFTESPTPDLLVHVSVIFHEQQSANAALDHYGYGGVYRPYVWGNGSGITAYVTHDVQYYTDGSLIIDVADAQTRKLLWEGIGNKRIYQETIDPEGEIPDAVKKIMSTFPPDR